MVSKMAKDAQQSHIASKKSPGVRPLNPLPKGEVAAKGRDHERGLGRRWKKGREGEV
jgi:hypothetical protein